MQRWTKEHRLQHTRSLLLDAAEELLARKGFSGASLGDIADAAGYTRGAIYGHFGSKEELFFAVIERHRQRFLDGFTDLMSSLHRLADVDLEELANRWRDLSSTHAERAAILEYELTLYLLRNPEARARLEPQRLETVRWLSEYVSASVAQMGGVLNLPAEDLARVILATNSGVTLNSHTDGTDLYRPFLQLVTSVISPKSGA